MGSLFLEVYVPAHDQVRWEEIMNCGGGQTFYQSHWRSESELLVELPGLVGGGGDKE